MSRGKGLRPQTADGTRLLRNNSSCTCLRHPLRQTQSQVCKRAAVTRWRQQRDKERAAAAAAAALLVSEGEAGEQAGLRHGDDTRHRVAATREHQVGCCGWCRGAALHVASRSVQEYTQPA